MAMFYTRDIPYGSAQTELQQVTENQALSRDWAPRTAQWTAKLSILTSSNSHYLLTHVLGSYVEQSMNGYSVWLCRNMQQHQKKKWFAVHFSYALKKKPQCLSPHPQSGADYAHFLLHSSPTPLWFHTYIEIFRNNCTGTRNNREGQKATGTKSQMLGPDSKAVLK